MDALMSCSLLSSERDDRTAVVEGDHRVPGDLPPVALRVAEVSGAAAPARVVTGDDVSAERGDGGEHVVDLVALVDVDGQLETATAGERTAGVVGQTSVVVHAEHRATEEVGHERPVGRRRRLRPQLRVEPPKER